VRRLRGPLVLRPREARGGHPQGPLRVRPPAHARAGPFPRRGPSAPADPSRA
jgi:hypothetical protein